MWVFRPVSDNTDLISRREQWLWLRESTYPFAVIEQVDFVAHAGGAGRFHVQVGRPSTLLGQVLRMVRLTGLAQHSDLRLPARRRTLWPMQIFDGGGRGWRVGGIRVVRGDTLTNERNGRSKKREQIHGGKGRKQIYHVSMCCYIFCCGLGTYGAGQMRAPGESIIIGGHLEWSHEQPTTKTPLK